MRGLAGAVATVGGVWLGIQMTDDTFWGWGLIIGITVGAGLIGLLREVLGD